MQRSRTQRPASHPTLSPHAVRATTHPDYFGFHYKEMPLAEATKQFDKDLEEACTKVEYSQVRSMAMAPITESAQGIHMVTMLVSATAADVHTDTALLLLAPCALTPAT